MSSSKTTKRRRRRCRLLRLVQKKFSRNSKFQHAGVGKWCPVCAKETTVKNGLTSHHLFPKRFWGDNVFTIPICRFCHDALEMKLNYADRSFVRWRRLKSIESIKGLSPNKKQEFVLFHMQVHFDFFGKSFHKSASLKNMNEKLRVLINWRGFFENVFTKDFVNELLNICAAEISKSSDLDNTSCWLDKQYSLQPGTFA